VSAPPSTSPWTLRLQLALSSLGPGAPGLALGGLVVLLLWFVALPAAQVGRDGALAEWQRAQAAAQGARDTAPAAAPADALADFGARLGGDDDVARLVQQIWRQGSAAGLQISKVDWRAEAEPGQGFARVTVTVPMTGPYTAMRKFSFGLLAAYPGLALDKLDMKRELASSGVVETTAHFTLYVRP